MKLQLAIKTLGLSSLLVAMSYLAPVAVDAALKEVGVESSVTPKAYAQTAKKRKPRKTPALSEKLFKSLGKVAEFASPPEESGKKPDFKAALAEARRAEKRCDKCNRYELAQVYNYLGWINYSLDNVDAAIKYYKKVVAQSPDISWGLEETTRYTIAQLLFSQEKYREALKELEGWFKIASLITGEAYSFKATICYQLGDKKCALSNISRAIKMIEDKGKIAKESWYNLLRAMYIEKENYKAAAQNLVKVVRHYPRKSYWAQLGGLYGILGQEKKQLHTMEAAYEMGAYSTEQQYIAMAYTYLQNDVPYKASKVFSAGFKKKIIARTQKNLETHAVALRQAKEIKKAIPVMSEAAEKADTGDLYGDLSGLYLDLDQNKNAIDAGNKAIRKGKLKYSGSVYLNMGIAQMNIKRYNSAIKSFKKAKEDKRTKKLADNWMRHAENELFRAQQLGLEIADAKK